MKKIILTAFILIISGCELFSPVSKSDYSKINIILPTSRELIDEATFYEIIVSASDFEDVVVTTEENSISVEVLLGLDRTFLLNIYNLDKSLLLYSGETTVDIISTDNANISIDVRRSAKLIVYHGNGETSGDVPSEVYYNDNTTVTVLGNTGALVLTGYSFLGWNTLQDGTGTTYLVDSSIDLAGDDINLYAIWSALPTYTVTYNLNGGSGTLPVDSNNYLQGQIVTLSGESEFSLSGSTFIGWSLTSGGSIISAPYSMPGNNITLYSIWFTADIVGYYAGDGSGSGGSGDYSTDYTKNAAGGIGGGDNDIITASYGNDVIFGDGNDIIFGDGFNGASGLGIGDYNGANGGFGGGGGGGGSQASPQGNGGIGGLFAGGGGAQSATSVGTSLFGGFNGGLSSKPASGTSQDDQRWGGNSAIPYNNGDGYFLEQSLGGSANNAFGAGGGAGFGGLNSQNQPINIASGLYQDASGGYGQGGDGQDGTTDLLLWEDSSGLLYTYVYSVLTNIFTTQIGTLDGVGYGNDIIDGQGGSDDLFGLNGDDTFIFEINDAGVSSTDTIWDFNRLAEYDKLKLTISGIVISDTVRDNIIADQTTSGTDRQLVFTDSGKTVNILIKSINRDISSGDFF